MNCQLPEHEIANIEVQLLSAKAVRHLSGLLCPAFGNEQEPKPQQRALHGQSFLSWGKSGVCHHKQLHMSGGENVFCSGDPVTSAARVLPNLLAAISNLDDWSRQP